MKTFLKETFDMLYQKISLVEGISQIFFKNQKGSIEELYKEFEVGYQFAGTRCV